MRNIIFLLLFICSQTQASSLWCEIQENTVTTFQTLVGSQLEQRTSIGEVAGIHTFVTEKSANYFELEAFIPDIPARFYAESQLLEQGHSIALTFWGRDQLISLKCSKRLIK
jgi:hypothetical protein